MVGVVGIEPTLLTAYLAAALRDYKFRPMANISNTPKKVYENFHKQCIMYYMKKCVNCQVDLLGKQTKWCSIKCKLAVLNSCHKKYSNQQKIGQNRKEHLIKLKGGSCE